MGVGVKFGGGSKVSSDLKPHVVLQALFCDEEPEERTDLDIANLLSHLGTEEAEKVAHQLYADRATLEVHIDEDDLPEPLRLARTVQVTSNPLPMAYSRVPRE